MKAAHSSWRSDSAGFTVPTTSVSAASFLGQPGTASASEIARTVNHVDRCLKKGTTRFEWRQLAITSHMIPATTITLDRQLASRETGSLGRTSRWLGLGTKA